MSDRMFWVEREDGEELGDYSGYVQNSWDEAIGVAGEIVAGGDSGWGGIGGDGGAMVVKEYKLVRSEVIKGIEEEE